MVVESIQRSKERFGFSEDAFLMTTVSKNLQGRMNETFATAIARILQRCQGAFYVPIGPSPPFALYPSIFENYDVDERVIFLGHLENPYAALVNMDMYLNEFPCGSGLSLLEAMAAGCPIVSMDYPYGPIQGRHGANYFSRDRCISPPSLTAYIELACSLIENRQKYKGWSHYALERYKERSNMDVYMGRHMHILRELRSCL